MNFSEVPYDRGFDDGEESLIDDAVEATLEARLICPYTEEKERRAYIAGFLDGAGFVGTSARVRT